jgi:hypothetical protein
MTWGGGAQPPPHQVMPYQIRFFGIEFVFNVWIETCGNGLFISFSISAYYILPETKGIAFLKILCYYFL